VFNLRPGWRVALVLGVMLMGPCAAQPAKPIMNLPKPANSAPEASPEVPNAPYAMNYSDEVAQTLGIHDGRLDAFSIAPPPKENLMPTLRGGVGKSGATVQLRWKTD
jgi:hypothetical protein